MAVNDSSTSKSKPSLGAPPPMFCLSLKPVCVYHNNILIFSQPLYCKHCSQSSPRRDETSLVQHQDVDRPNADETMVQRQLHRIPPEDCNETSMLGILATVASRQRCDNINIISDSSFILPHRGRDNDLINATNTSCPGMVDHLPSEIQIIHNEGAAARKECTSPVPMDEASYISLQKRGKARLSRLPRLFVPSGKRRLFGSTMPGEWRTPRLVIPSPSRGPFSMHASQLPKGVPLAAPHSLKYVPVGKKRKLQHDTLGILSSDLQTYEEYIGRASTGVAPEHQAP